MTMVQRTAEFQATLDFRWPKAQQYQYPFLLRLRDISRLGRLIFGVLVQLILLPGAGDRGSTVGTQGTNLATLGYLPCPLNPAKLIGTVEASDADAAIEAAIREFHVTDQHAKRLIAVLRG
jgi:hypothetical protein